MTKNAGSGFVNKCVRIQGSRSEPKCHGSGPLLQNMSFILFLPQQRNAFRNNEPIDEGKWCV